MAIAAIAVGVLKSEVPDIVDAGICRILQYLPEVTLASRGKDMKTLFARTLTAVSFTIKLVCDVLDVELIRRRTNAKGADAKGGVS